MSDEAVAPAERLPQVMKMGEAVFQAPMMMLAETQRAWLLPPAVVVALCVLAGIGTFMMLPSRREAPVAKIGVVVAVTAGLILMGLLAARVAVGMTAYFWIFSALAVGSALRLITHSRPVYCALYFVLSVLSTAGLFVLLWAEFMAVALVLVYAGAILVTYVFVIMLSAQVHVNLPGREGAAGGADYDQQAREPLAVTVLGFGLMAVLLFVIFEQVEGLAPLPSDPNAIYLAGVGDFQPTGTAQLIGLYLFESHMVSVQVAAIILTVGLVGAIVVARRRVPLEHTPMEDVDERFVPSSTADDPHELPISGTDNPRQKAYPEK